MQKSENKVQTSSEKCEELVISMKEQEYNFDKMYSLVFDWIIQNFRQQESKIYYFCYKMQTNPTLYTDKKGCSLLRCFKDSLKVNFQCKKDNSKIYFGCVNLKADDLLLPEVKNHIYGNKYIFLLPKQKSIEKLPVSFLSDLIIDDNLENGIFIALKKYVLNNDGRIINIEHIHNYGTGEIIYKHKIFSRVFRA